MGQSAGRRDVSVFESRMGLLELLVRAKMPFALAPLVVIDPLFSRSMVAPIPVVSVKIPCAALLGPVTVIAPAFSIVIRLSLRGVKAKTPISKT